MANTFGVGIMKLNWQLMLIVFWFFMNLIAIPLAILCNLIQDLLYLISPKLTVRFNEWILSIWLSIGDDDDE